MMIVAGISFLACAFPLSFGWFFVWRFASGIAGAVLMAMAGYDPHAAITLWERIASLSTGKGGPQWSSTHPTDAARLADIRSWVPEAMKYYRPRE